jgi:hypothetical protein
MTDGEINAVEISNDGERLICMTSEGKIRWSKGAPSSYDWQRLVNVKVEQNLARGKFQYAGAAKDGTIIAVFTPFGGLDFNLIYSIDTGELIKIHEAR